MVVPDSVGLGFSLSDSPWRLTASSSVLASCQCQVSSHQRHDLGVFRIRPRRCPCPGPDYSPHASCPNEIINREFNRTTTCGDSWANKPSCGRHQFLTPSTVQRVSFRLEYRCIRRRQVHGLLFFGRRPGLLFGRVYSFLFRRRICRSCELPPR